MNSVVVEFQGQGLQKGDVVGHDFFVREVELMNDDGINVIIGEQVIWKGRTTC